MTLGRVILMRKALGRMPHYIVRPDIKISLARATAFSRMAFGRVTIRMAQKSPD
jgi:hypothetical protein